MRWSWRSFPTRVFLRSFTEAQGTCTPCGNASGLTGRAVLLQAGGVEQLDGEKNSAKQLCLWCFVFWLFISVFLFKPQTNKFLAFILLHRPHFSLSSVEHNFLDKHAPALLPTAETNGHQAYCSFCAGIVEELEGT